ncbi:MAG: tetratricopeptide (TPR) repeat protein [Cryomorphaceae bacterium]|jgi:tetratricopeptide (TPR) repeat protein
MMVKLAFISFYLSCSLLPAHEDPNDVLHVLSHKLEHAKIADKPELYFQRAIEYRASGQKEKAKADLLRYTELEPTDHLGWLELGRVEAEAKNRLIYLTKSLDLANSDEAKSMSYYELAAHFYGTQNYQMALKKCESAIRLDKQKKLTPMLLKSHLLWQLRGLDERVDFLTVAKKKNPSIVLQNSWIDAMIDAGKVLEVKKMIDKEIQTSRFRSSWYIRAALCEPKHSDQAKEKAQLAISEIKERLNEKRPDVTLLMDLALAYVIIEKNDGAAQYLTRAKLMNHDPWAMVELEQKIKATVIKPN